MTAKPIQQLELPRDEGQPARAWTIRTAGGHRVRVGIVPGTEARVATVSAALSSSPTNGAFVAASMFAWPIRVGEPITVATSEQANDHWGLNAAFIEGPQAPLPDGTFGAEWVVSSIELEDLERRRPVDEFDDDGRLVHCLHGHDHTPQPCGCADGCCRAGHLASLDLAAAQGWWAITTQSGTRYLIEHGGRTVVRLGRDGSVIGYRSARIRPPVLEVGGGTWRLDTSDQWAKPTGVRSIRPATPAELEEIGAVGR